MRPILITFFIAGLSACNSSTDKTVKEEKADTTNTVVARSLNVETINMEGIPKSVSYKGKVQDAFHWKDSVGENIFFTTQVAPYNDNDKGEAGEDGRTAELYAYHYVRTDGDYKLAWQMSDRELSCPLDIVTEFIPGSTTVTDIDKDGVGETKVQYSLACRGDVSPSSMKLIMQENQQVYTLNGYRWMSFGPESKFDVNSSNVNLENLPMLDDGEDALLRSFGRYETEKYFRPAPPSFLEYAKNEWLKYVIEKIN